MSVIRDDMLEALKSFSSPEEAKAHFDRWAPHYDADFLERFGYIAPSIVANAFTKDQVPRSCSILEAGCGTGLIGEELKKRGYLNLYGADFSDAMRAEAEKKNTYRRLIAADFTKRTSILDGVYDVVLAADCFGPGQCGPTHLPVLIRLVRRGGQIYILVETEFFERAKFADAIAGLEKQKQWNVVRILSASVMKLSVRTIKIIVAERS